MKYVIISLLWLCAAETVFAAGDGPLEEQTAFIWWRNPGGSVQIISAEKRDWRKLREEDRTALAPLMSNIRNTSIFPGAAGLASEIGEFVFLLVDLAGSDDKSEMRKFSASLCKEAEDLKPVHAAIWKGSRGSWRLKSSKEEVRGLGPAMKERVTGFLSFRGSPPAILFKLADLLQVIFGLTDELAGLGDNPSKSTIKGALGRHMAALNPFFGTLLRQVKPSASATPESKSPNGKASRCHPPGGGSPGTGSHAASPSGWARRSLETDLAFSGGIAAPTLDTSPMYYVPGRSHLTVPDGVGSAPSTPKATKDKRRGRSFLRRASDRVLAVISRSPSRSRSKARDAIVRDLADAAVSHNYSQGGGSPSPLTVYVEREGKEAAAAPMVTIPLKSPLDAAREAYERKWLEYEAEFKEGRGFSRVTPTGPEALQIKEYEEALVILRDALLSKDKDGLSSVRMRRSSLADGSPIGKGRRFSMGSSASSASVDASSSPPTTRSQTPSGRWSKLRARAKSIGRSLTPSRFRRKAEV